jgi:hypothetical protein
MPIVCAHSSPQFVCKTFERWISDLVLILSAVLKFEAVLLICLKSMA